MTPQRIKLMNCDEQLIATILKGDQHLAKQLNINVPKQWSASGKVIFELALERIKKKPASKIWFAYLPIETNTNTLLGTCGFKGEPDKSGSVEIGYEVAKAFRNQGYATEITRLLIT